MEVLDFYEVPKPCFVMRFVVGGDLLDYIEMHGALDTNESFVILKGIGDGLKHLHGNQIVHCDLKSPNILLEDDGYSIRPVLIDLGLGRMLEDGPSSSLKDTDGMKGSVVWMAPEMIKDNKWGSKTDMYALGIIMWEILSGKISLRECRGHVSASRLHCHRRRTA